MNVWYNTVKQTGWRSIAAGFSEYSPPYIYLLYIVHKIFPALSNIEAVKLPSILADFVNAALGMGIVYTITKSRLLSLLCFSSLLLAPTIIINSAYWGQSDSLLACPILLSVWCLLRKKPVLSLFAFGIAFSLKFQTIFLAPFFLVLVLINYLPWKTIFAFPFAVFLLWLPAWLAGRPVRELLTIYSSQAEIYKYLTMHAASAYAWMEHANYDAVAPAGVLFTTGVCLAYCAAIYFRKKRTLQSRDIILLGTLSSVMVPFFLPNMHERYFYLLDVFSILLLFCYPKLFYIPILAQLISFLTYQPYLTSQEVIPLSVLAFGYLFILMVLAQTAIQSLFFSGINPSAEPHPNREYPPDQPTL